MNVPFVIFTCVVFLAAGALFAWFLSADEFEGLWVSLGVMDGDRLVPFPGEAVRHTVSFDEGQAAYFINDEQMEVTRSGRILRVELAAQICMEYRMSIHEGRLILAGPGGMRMVFEKVSEEE